MISSNRAGPHRFNPIRWWDQYRKQGRCKGCYIPRDRHDEIRQGGFWVAARPIGDMSAANCSVDGTFTDDGDGYDDGGGVEV